MARSIRADIPVLMVTGFIDAGAQEKARAAGVGEILIKPVAPEVLGQAVNRALGKPKKD